MKRMRLVNPATLAGHTVLGRETKLAIVDRQIPGIFWRTPRGVEVPIQKGVLGYNPLMHCLTLSHGAERMRIVEHMLGCLYAAGADGLALYTDAGGLPYDGTARKLWGWLKPLLVEDGELDRWTPRETVEIRDEKNPLKYLILHPDSQATSLEYEVTVDYGHNRQARVAGTLGETELDTLFSGRPYWQKLHRAVVRMAEWSGRWPHHIEDMAADFDAVSGEARREVLRGIAWHRLLDFLGTLATCTPPGGTIVGYARMRLTGHPHDLLFKKKLKIIGLRPL